MPGQKTYLMDANGNRIGHTVADAPEADVPPQAVSRDKLVSYSASPEGVNVNLSNTAKGPSEFRVNSHTADNQNDASVTALSVGGFVVTWASEDQDGAGIYGQRYGSNGTAAGADTLDGGAGMDFASYLRSDAGVTVNLGEGDTLSNIENLGGSRHDDDLNGNGGNNILRGGSGNDTLQGGAEEDILTGGAEENMTRRKTY